MTIRAPRPRYVLACVLAGLVFAGAPALGRPGGAVASTIASADEPVTVQWRKRVMGLARSLATADLDGDGRAEMVASMSADVYQFRTRTWHILKWDGRTYVQTFTSPWYPEEVMAIAVANTDSDPALEVIVALYDKLHIHDGATYELQQTVAIAGNSWRILRVADVDRDGSLEALLGGEYGFQITDLATGVSEFSSETYRAVDFDLGNVDNDPDLEIVLCGCGFGSSFVLNGATRAVEWAPGVGFGLNVEAADVDGDGREEIISGAGNAILIFDAELHSIKSSLSLAGQGTQRDLEVGDVDGDGSLEIVYSDDHWVHVLDPSSLATRWKFGAPSTRSLRVADPDGDGAPEIVWHDPRLRVLSGTTRQIEWLGDAVKGPFFAFAAADVDLDGRKDLLSLALDSPAPFDDDGYLLIQDAATGQESFRGPVRVGTNFSPWKVAAGNVDSDPQPEIFVATVQGYEGWIFCYDGVTRLEQWRRNLSDTIHRSDYPQSLALADVDGDGDLDLVAGVTSNSYSEGAKIRVFDPQTGSEQWRSAMLGLDALHHLRISNVDGDPALEIVAAGQGGAVYTVDAVTRVITNTPDLNVTALDTVDQNGDGVSEILIGAGGNLLAITPAGVTTDTVASWGEPINAIRSLNLDGVSGNEYVIAGRTRVGIVRAGCELWRSPVLNDAVNQVGARDSLLVEDLDNDGRVEVVVNIGELGFEVYEVGPLATVPCCGGAAPVPDGGFEAGSPWPAWTEQSSAAFGTPICGPGCVPGAPASGPQAGAHWARFGATSAPDTSTLGQSMVLPAADRLTLGLQMFAGAISYPLTDSLELTVDSIPVRIFTEPGVRDEGYGLREVDLSPFADGASHSVLFTYRGPTSSPAIFNIDSLTLRACSIAALPAPSLSVGDATVIEGDAGSRDAVFAVTLTADSALPVSASISTVSGTAMAGGDYAATGPVLLTFAPGVRVRTFAVPVHGDALLEGAESFGVTLSNPVNAPILDGTGLATIIDDELPSRTFVSTTGSDASNCSLLGSPCRNVGAALTQTARDGEVIVLGPGEYETGPLTITKGIKITSPAATVAFIRQPIIVNAPGGRVVLRGLTLKGNGTGEAITLTSVDALSIEDTTIDRWSAGLKLAGASSASVAILNSTFRATATAVKDLAGAAAHEVAIEESRFERSGTGIELVASAVRVRASMFVGHTGSGLLIGPGTADIRQSLFWGNGAGVTSLPGGVVRISRSHVFGNTVGFSADGASTFLSFGTNVVRGNGTDVTGTITLVPEQ